MKDRVLEITEAEQKKKIIENSKNSLRDLWNGINNINIPTIGSPHNETRERKEKVTYLKK